MTPQERRIVDRMAEIHEDPRNVFGIITPEFNQLISDRHILMFVKKTGEQYLIERAS